MYGVGGGSGGGGSGGGAGGGGGDSGGEGGSEGDCGGGSGGGGHTETLWSASSADLNTELTRGWRRKKLLTVSCNKLKSLYPRNV